MTHSGAVLAVDVGGTTIKAAVIDASGRILTEMAQPTAADRGPDAIVSQLLAVIAALREQQPEVRALGVVVPGVVDGARGVAKFSANLGFRDLPIARLVEQATGLPALLDHDVRAAGVAEYAVGLTAGCEDSLLVVIGTGIAGVIHAAGSSVHGATGVAGELGHIPVWPGGESCPCGQRGCLERYASAAAIARRYGELSGRPEISASAVADRLMHDQLAVRVWGEATRALALALATCTMLLDPAVIVLAGGLSEAGPALLEPVRSELAAAVRWREPPAVLLSGLGGRAGLLGAAVLSWQTLGIEDFQGWRQRV